MFGLILLDLDGTLVDTAPDIADALNGVLAERGLPPMPEAWVRNRIGHGARQLLSQAWELADTTAAAGRPAPLAELLEQFAARYHGCCGRGGRTYPDALATLGALRTAGVKLALLTNKEQRFAQLVLEAHGLDGRFDLELCGDTAPAPKPDPAGVRQALGRFGIPAGRAVLVGDSAVDVQTARNAGVAAWAVRYGYNGGEPIESARPDRVIDGLAELCLG